MLDGLRQFIADIVAPHAQDRAFGDSDYRLAATALLVHVVSLDGQPTADRAAQAARPDRKPFRARSRHRGSADADATQVEGEAVDLYHFTSVIMRSLDEEGRKRIVQMMWELVYADGQVTEFEDNVVWRASDLLGIAQRDRIDLKHAVADRAGGQVKDSAVGG